MNNPIIILEGLDRTGKSTLANQLANHFGPGAIKHHSGSPPKHLTYPQNLIWEENNYYLLMEAFNKASRFNTVVIDRFHLGCPVFGKRYRKYPETVTTETLERQMCIGYNTFLVLLTDDSEELFKRDDGLSFEKSADDFDKTCTEFIKEFSNSTIDNKLHINITKNGGFSQSLPSILKFIESV